MTCPDNICTVKITMTVGNLSYMFEESMNTAMKPYYIPNIYEIKTSDGLSPADSLPKVQ